MDSPARLIINPAAVFDPASCIFSTSGRCRLRRAALSPFRETLKSASLVFSISLSTPRTALSSNSLPDTESLGVLPLDELRESTLRRDRW